MRRNRRRAFPFRRFAPEERGERFFQGCRRGKESLPRRTESGEIAYGAVHGELSLRSDFGGDEEERACPDCCEKIRRKADDGGLRNADVFAELGGRHKHDFVIMRYNTFGNAPVAFRKLLAAVVEALDQFLRVFQGQYPPLHAFP